MNPFQGISIPANFLFISVAQLLVAEHNGSNARLIGNNSLNPVRRNRAFNQSVFSQSFECLRRLVCKKLLFSSRLSQICQVPRGVRRNRLDSGHELSQRPHEFFLSAIPLSNQVRSESSVIACHSNVSQLVTATAGSIWWGQ